MQWVLLQHLLIKSSGTIPSVSPPEALAALAMTPSSPKLEPPNTTLTPYDAKRAPSSIAYWHTVTRIWCHVPAAFSAYSGRLPRADPQYTTMHLPAAILLPSVSALVSAHERNETAQKKAWLGVLCWKKMELNVPTAILVVFIGCCSNVVFLELLIKYDNWSNRQKIILS